MFCLCRLHSHTQFCYHCKWEEILVWTCISEILYEWDRTWYWVNKVTLPESEVVRLFCVRFFKAQHIMAMISTNHQWFSDLLPCVTILTVLDKLRLSNHDIGDSDMTIHSTAHYLKCLWGFLISNNLSLGRQCLRFPPSSSFTVSSSRWENQRHNQQSYRIL